MRQNVGSADRATRFFAGVAFLFIAIVGLGLTAGQPAGIIIAIAGIASLLSSAFAFCPGYAMFGVSTRENAPPSVKQPKH